MLGVSFKCSVKAIVPETSQHFRRVIWAEQFSRIKGIDSSGFLVLHMQGSAVHHGSGQSSCHIFTLGRWRKSVQAEMKSFLWKLLKFLWLIGVCCGYIRKWVTWDGRTCGSRSRLGGLSSDPFTFSFCLTNRKNSDNCFWHDVWDVVSSQGQ